MIWKGLKDMFQHAKAKSPPGLVDDDRRERRHDLLAKLDPEIEAELEGLRRKSAPAGTDIVTIEKAWRCWIDIADLFRREGGGLIAVESNQYFSTGNMRWLLEKFASVLPPRPSATDLSLIQCDYCHGKRYFVFKGDMKEHPEFEVPCSSCWGSGTMLSNSYPVAEN